jgi:hypothetical protein
MLSAQYATEEAPLNIALTTPAEIMQGIPRFLVWLYKQKSVSLNEASVWSD